MDTRSPIDAGRNKTPTFFRHDALDEGLPQEYGEGHPACGSGSPRGVTSGGLEVDQLLVQNYLFCTSEDPATEIIVTRGRQI